VVVMVVMSSQPRRGGRGRCRRLWVWVSGEGGGGELTCVVGTRRPHSVEVVSNIVCGCE
jgi:hypothetical protein